MSDDKRALALAEFESTRQRYVELFRELDSARPREAAERQARFEAGARAKGITVLERIDEIEMEEARTGRYISHEWNDGFAMIMAWVITLLIAVATGAVLLTVFLVVGRSPVVAVGGTIVGVLGGAILVPILFFGTDAALSRLVRHTAHHRTIRHLARAAFEGITLALLLLPAVITLVASVILE